MEVWQIVLLVIFCIIFAVLFAWSEEHPSKIEIARNIDRATLFNRTQELEYWLEKLAELEKGEKQHGKI